MRILIVALMSLLPWAAMAQEFKVGDLLIDHPRIVETPPGAKVAAGYVTIRNSGGTDDRLVAIESSINVEMHVSKVVDGIASMKKMDGGFAVPAGATVGLGENGTHAMFMGLTKQLKAGEKVDAVLVFEKAGRVDVVFDVEKRSAKMNETHDNQ
ncbi:copper chaperone PCu(A)C [Rhizobium sp.]